MTGDPKNVVLVTVDSLRSDHVGCYGYQPNTTPFIDSIAETGTRFANAIATSSHTKHSFPGIFTSTLPSQQGQPHIDPNRTTLAEQFKNEGYHTAGFHSTPMMIPENSYDKGFDVFVDLARSGDDNLVAEFGKQFAKHLPESLLQFGHRLVNRLQGTALLDYMDKVQSRAPAKEITDAALTHITDQAQPFFLFVHYMDAHTPYHPPSQYVEQFCDTAPDTDEIDRVNDTLLGNKNRYRGDPSSVSDEDICTATGLYDASIRYTDDNIKRLVHGLNEAGLCNETMFVVSADHGDEFREHGGFFHGEKVYDELLHVPLIFAGPSTPSETIQQQVSLLDIAPTILEQGGILSPEEYSGQNLGPVFDNQSKTGTEYALSETTIKQMGQNIGRVIGCRYQNKRKLIYNERIPDWSDSEWELYNIDDDPAEKDNVIDSNKNDEILSEMKRRIQSVQSGIAPNETATVDETVQDRLTELGYT